MSRVQELLCSDEYSEFVDSVIIEDEFVLAAGLRCEHVHAALTSDKLIIAVGDGENGRTEKECLELDKLVPLPFLRLSVVDELHKRLQVNLAGREAVYLEHRGNESKWSKWLNHIDMLNDRAKISPFHVDSRLHALVQDSLTRLYKRTSKNDKIMDDSDDETSASGRTNRAQSLPSERNFSFEDKLSLSSINKSKAQREKAKLSTTTFNKTDATPTLTPVGESDDYLPKLRGAQRPSRLVKTQSKRRRLSLCIKEAIMIPHSRVTDVQTRRSRSTSNMHDNDPHCVCNRFMDEAAHLDRNVLLKRLSQPSMLRGAVTFLSGNPSAPLMDSTNSSPPPTSSAKTASTSVFGTSNRMINCMKLENDGVVSFLHHNPSRKRRTSLIRGSSQTRTARPGYIRKQDPSKPNPVTECEKKNSGENIDEIVKEFKKSRKKARKKDKGVNSEVKPNGDNPENKRETFVEHIIRVLRPKRRRKQPGDEVDRSYDQDEMIEPVLEFEKVTRDHTSPRPSDSHKEMIDFVLALKSSAVAKELTITDKKLFFRIPSKELEECLWTKRNKYEVAPNTMKMIDFFERMANLVASQILMDPAPSGRAKIIAKFISIAHKCRRLQNFNSMRAILGGLQLTPIFRLEKTWKHVMYKYPRKYRIFTDLSDLMGHEDNFSRYRDALKKALTKPPCVPFIGVFLQTIMAVDTVKDVRGYKKKKHKQPEKAIAKEGRRGSIFDNAKSRVQNMFLRSESEDHVTLNVPSMKLRSRNNKLSSFQLSDSDISTDEESKPAFLKLRPRDMLFQYQMAALPYNFPTDAVVSEFILRADYNTDEENYALSLQREPVERYSSSSSSSEEDIVTPNAQVESIPRPLVPRPPLISNSHTQSMQAPIPKTKQISSFPTNAQSLPQNGQLMPQKTMTLPQKAQPLPPQTVYTPAKAQTMPPKNKLSSQTAQLMSPQNKLTSQTAQPMSPQNKLTSQTAQPMSPQNTTSQPKTKKKKKTKPETVADSPPKSPTWSEVFNDSPTRTPSPPQQLLQPQSLNGGTFKSPKEIGSEKPSQSARSPSPAKTSPDSPSVSRTEPKKKPPAIEKTPPKKSTQSPKENTQPAPIKPASGTSMKKGDRPKRTAPSPNSKHAFPSVATDESQLLRRPVPTGKQPVPER